MSETRLEFNDDQGRRIVRVDKDVFTVGRRAGNDLQLLGNEISRDHAEFALVNGAWMLRDNDSRYGSFRVVMIGWVRSQPAKAGLTICNHGSDWLTDLVNDGSSQL